MTDVDLLEQIKTSFLYNVGRTHSHVRKVENAKTRAEKLTEIAEAMHVIGRAQEAALLYRRCKGTLPYEMAADNTELEDLKVKLLLMLCPAGQKTAAKKEKNVLEEDA